MVPRRPPGVTTTRRGRSCCCPMPRCTLLEEHELTSPSHCRVSRLASRGDPRHNRDYRNNPSLLISHRNHDDDDDTHHQGLRHVVVDVGKTFREGALRWMPPHDDQGTVTTNRVDAIVLTHEHMDAMGGLDDVRGFQRTTTDDNGKRTAVPVPIHLSAQCLAAVQRQFPYLVPKPPQPDDDGTPKVVRHVAALQFHVVEPFRPFVAAGLTMTPLPVLHGEDMICLGYAFTLRGNDNKTTNVVYLSDISRMPAETDAFIVEQLPQPIDVLIVDSLRKEATHPTHFNLTQAVALARRLRPRRTYVVGMSCDDFLPHDAENRALATDPATHDLHLRLAHDGLVLSCA